MPALYCDGIVTTDKRVQREEERFTMAKERKVGRRMITPLAVEIVRWSTAPPPPPTPLLELTIIIIYYNLFQDNRIIAYGHWMSTVIVD